MPDTNTPEKGKRKRGRPGVTYERVAQACLAVRAAGNNVTVIRVQQVLGTGSTGTLHPMVGRWNKENPPANMVATPNLSDRLLRDIGKELDQIAADSKAEVQQVLQDALEAADKYAADNRAMEAEQDALQEQVDTLAEERDKALVLTQQQALEILRLRETMAAEQVAAEHTRVELAKAQLKADAEAVRLQDQADEITRLRAELATESAGRRKAETDLATATAQLAAEREAKKDAAKREADALVREREALAKAETSKSAADTAKTGADKLVLETKAEFDRLATEYKAKLAELEKALASERDKTTASGATATMLKAQIEDLKTRLDRAEARLENDRETYQAIAAKAVSADGQIVLPKSRKSGAGAQMADRQT